MKTKRKARTSEPKRMALSELELAQVAGGVRDAHDRYANETTTASRG